jgi:hypothetical protein
MTWYNYVFKRLSKQFPRNIFHLAACIEAFMRCYGLAVFMVYQDPG